MSCPRVSGYFEILEKDEKYFIETNMFLNDGLPMEELLRKEVFNLRITNEIGVIYKKGSKFYYKKIPNANPKTRLPTLKENKCLSCSRFSPIPTSQGGCDKVFDLEPRLIRNNSLTENQKKNMIFHSKRIEKYSFITEGIELLNGKAFGIKVLDCLKYNPVKKIY